MSVLTKDLFEGLGSFGDHEGAEREFRSRMRGFYYDVADLTSAGVTEEEYEEFLFPFDTEADQTGFADGMWSCALTVLGKWRQMGVKAKALEGPYRAHIGSAISDVKEIARQYGALCDGNLMGGYELEQGDAFVVGTGNNLHAILVGDVTTDERGTTILDVVEGGQGSKGKMAIRKGQYVLEKRNGVLAARRQSQSIGRPVAFGVALWELVLGAGLLKS